MTRILNGIFWCKAKNKKFFSAKNETNKNINNKILTSNQLRVEVTENRGSNPATASSSASVA